MFISIVEFIAIIVLTLLVGSLFYYGFKRRGPWGSFWSFLLVLFLGIMLAAIWADPIGPMWYGVAWLDFLFIGLLFALILAAATPSHTDRLRYRERYERVSTSQEEAAAAVAIGAYFWILLTFLLLAIIIGIFV